MPFKLVELSWKYHAIKITSGWFRKNVSFYKVAARQPLNPGCCNLYFLILRTVLTMKSYIGLVFTL